MILRWTIVHPVLTTGIPLLLVVARPTSGSLGAPVAVDFSITSALRLGPAVPDPAGFSLVETDDEFSLAMQRKDS